MVGSAHLYMAFFILPSLFVAAGCSKHVSPVSGPEDYISGEAPAEDSCNVRVKLAGIFQYGLTVGSCMLFALDSDGEVAIKERVENTGDSCINWKMRTGTYRIKGVANCSEADAAEIWKCEDERELGAAVIGLEGVEGEVLPAVLDIGGEDLSVSLGAGQCEQVNISGKSAMAKISLGGIMNSTSVENMPLKGPCTIRCRKMILVDAPCSSTLSGSVVLPLANPSEQRLFTMDEGCIRADGSGKDIPEGEYGQENLSVYCFPNISVEESLVLAVNLELDGDEYWYNIDIGKVAAGQEYRIERLNVMKTGSSSPFDPTPSIAFGAVTLTEEWERGNEGGLAGESAGGQISYSLGTDHLSLDAPRNITSLEFAEIYGAARVTSSNNDAISVEGAGKSWLLAAGGRGHSVITYSDGYSAGSFPMCAGNSVQCRWLDTDGNILTDSDTLYTWQLCRLKADDWWGELGIDMDGSIFKMDSGTQGDYLLYVGEDDGEDYVVMNDHFGSILEYFPGMTTKWNLSDCPRSVNPSNGWLRKDSVLSARVQFPFDIINESAMKPSIRILDPDGNIKKYGISITYRYIGNILAVSATTTYSGLVKGLNISVRLSMGDQEIELLKINVCDTILVIL